MISLLVLKKKKKKLTKKIINIKICMYDSMSKTNEPSLDDILYEIKTIENRMKKARMKNDKIGYELALKRQEEIYKKYNHILFKKRDPTAVFEKKY